MADIANDPKLEAVRKKYRTEMNNLADDIATGCCRNYEDYKYRTGILEGLVLAERLLLDYDVALTES